MRIFAWLCRFGLHSWIVLGQRDGQAWNLYIEVEGCRRCHKIRTSEKDQMDQLSGI